MFLERYHKLILGVLLGIVFLIPFFSMQTFSPASDEITHLPSGYTYLKTGELKLNPQHPPLIKMLAAVPLLFMNLEFNPDDPNLSGVETNEWQFGRDFLSKNGVDRLIFWGRIPMILLSVLLGWYVYRWGRDLFGPVSGLVGLFVYALMPNIIAHSQFIATDMGLAAFSFISLYYLWKFMDEYKKGQAVTSGIFLGLALGSKFSAVFLLPIFGTLLAIFVWRKLQKSRFLLKVNLFIKIIIPILTISFLTVWGLHFFPRDPLFYWHGLNTVYADHNADYYYYLNGQFSQSGWWYYFVWAFIIKTPIPFLTVLALALAYFKKLKLNFLNLMFIFLPVAIFLFMASWKAHNIGVRYILAVYPFLILYVGGFVSKQFLISNFESISNNLISKFKNSNFIQNSKFKIQNYNIKTILVLILIIWYIFSVVNVYPDYLAYFNEFVGGSNNGYKYLDDSNIDWGYDLKRLKQYQLEYPELKVAYVWDKYVSASQLYGIENLQSLDSADLWLYPIGKYAMNVHAIIRTRLAGQVNENEQLNWMDRYEPIDRIGQSFFIYEF